MHDRSLISPQAEDVTVVSPPGVARAALAGALGKELEEIGLDFCPAAAEGSEPEKYTRE
jgi:hypothetical protein